MNELVYVKNGMPQACHVLLAGPWEPRYKPSGTCLDDRTWETPEPHVQAELGEPRKPLLFLYSTGC